GQGVTGVILQGLGDQFAVGVEVLHPLGHHLDLDIGDNVTTHVGAFLAWQRFGYAAGGRGVVVRRGIGEFIVRRRLPFFFIWRKRWLARAWLIDLDGIAVESRIGEQLGRFLEVENGEPVLVEVFIYARPATDDLLELGHGLDTLIQHNKLAGLGIDARGHQLGSGRDDGVFAFREDEVVQLHLAFFIVAGDAHDIAVVLRHQVGVFVDQRLAHAFGMVDVVAEDDGLVEAVAGFQVFTDLARHHVRALFQYQRLVKITLVIDTVFDLVSRLLLDNNNGTPAGQ